MVKSIIKRIIVGVGVALVLMSLSKHGLIANAYALSCDTNSNSSMHPITSVEQQSWILSGSTSAPQWGGFNLSPSYRFNWPSSNPDYIDVKIPTSWSVSTSSTTSPKLNTYDFSGVFFYLRLKNSRNSTGDYRGYYKDNFLVVRIYHNAVGDYFDIEQFRVAVPPFNGTSEDIVHIWLFVTDWWQVEHYICDSNAALQQSIDENTQAVEDVNNSINDNSTDDPTGNISTMNGKVASNNSITQLLTLPIQMYQNILNAVSGSCSSFSLGSLYNHNLTLPCINLQNLLGSTLYGIIDILISGLFILSFRKKMVDIFNHMTSLNDRGNELE